DCTHHSRGTRADYDDVLLHGHDRNRKDLPVLCACFTPHAGQPGLLFARQAIRAVIMRYFGEARAGHVAPPAFQIIVHAITPLSPSCFIVAPGIGAEQYSTWLEGSPELLQYPGQFAHWDMEQGGIGKYPVESPAGQIEL